MFAFALRVRSCTEEDTGVSSKRSADGRKDGSFSGNNWDVMSLRCEFAPTGSLRCEFAPVRNELKSRYWSQ